MNRRVLLELGAGLALFHGMPRSLRARDAAASWPNKTVRLIIPFTPGGSTDFQGRLLCDWLSRHFAAFIRGDTERWAPAIRASGARVE